MAIGMIDKSLIREKLYQKYIAPTKKKRQEYVGIEVELTFRGTIEFRSVCCQPITDVMTVAAFHLGLKNQLEELDRLLQEDMVLYHHGFSATELRKMFVKQKLPGFVEKVALYGRINKRVNPARKMMEQLSADKNIEDIILDYGCLGLQNCSE